METSESLKHNVGTSNYSQKPIQPWQIWMAYPELNPWEADIIKRVLRSKGSTPAERRANKILDLQKIKHITEYLIENQDVIYKHEAGE